MAFLQSSIRLGHTRRFFQTSAKLCKSSDSVFEHPDVPVPEISAVPFRGDYSQKAADARRRWAEDITKTPLHNLDGWWEPINVESDEKYLMANIENAIGVARIPIGIVGPINICGKYANGQFLVPASTTEGTLLASASRGCTALNKSGGVNVNAFRQRMLRTPTIFCGDSDQAERLGEWIEKSVPRLHDVVSTVSRRAKMQSVTSFRDGERLNLFFSYDTGEAAGQNMTTSCTAACCRWILKQAREELPDVKVRWLLGENSLSGDKKLSSMNALFGRGVSVEVHASIPEEVVKSVFKVDSDTFEYMFEHFRDLNHRAGSPFLQAGNVSNMIAAIFAATGQDLGSVGECSQAFLNLKKRKGTEGGIDAKLRMPNLTVGTVGGGTALPTQMQCLEMIGCTGPKSNLKLAEIIASVCLAADLSLLSSILAGTHAASHDKLGRNRPVS